MMTTPDAVAGFASILPTDPVGFEPAVPARIVMQMRADRPARRANLVTCPLLVCVCERDVIAPPQPAITVAERAPSGELCCYPIGHFDLFHTPWLPTASSKIRSPFCGAHCSNPPRPEVNCLDIDQGSHHPLASLLGQEIPQL